MKEKTRYRLVRAVNAVILAGVIIFFTGAYYCVIKAGIPYQDPPLELQIQYAVDMGVGEVLVKDGFAMVCCGGTVRLLLWLICRYFMPERTK